MPAMVRRSSRSPLDRAVAFSRAAYAPERVSFAQRGALWRTPGAVALPFRAREDMRADESAFHWRARFWVGPLPLVVEDALEGGRGRLVGRMLGMRVLGGAGRLWDLGETYRYLAEIPWVPAAYLRNPALAWETLDDATLRVRAEAGGREAVLDFDVDPVGRVRAAHARARPREVDGTFVDTPWTARYEAWEKVHGVWIPTRGSVIWHLPEGEFAYFVGETVGWGAA